MQSRDPMLRYARQSRLAGIGPEGQARIARASTDVSLDGLAGEVATRYLAGGGMGSLRVRSESQARTARSVDAGARVIVRPELAAEPVEGPELRDPSAREIARGALYALRALRSAAGQSS